MNLIVAVDQHWGIGLDDHLLFRISEDMKRFRALTIGKAVVLGRRTLRSFPGGRALEKRTNIVLTRNPDFMADQVLPCHSLAELGPLLAGWPAEAVFVIGGASIYQLLLPFCHLAYVTKVDQAAPADCYFPDLDQLPGWHLLSQEDHPQGSGLIIGQAAAGPVPLHYRFCVYRQESPRELLDGY